MEKLLDDEGRGAAAAARIQARERERLLLVDAITELTFDRSRALGVDARTGRGPAARAGDVPAF